ncbi:MAG TPA: hypothetical protein VGL29_11650 [Blastocatellia bacterium]|jgi:hypothetical protein
MRQPSITDSWQLSLLADGFVEWDLVIEARFARFFRRRGDLGMIGFDRAQKAARGKQQSLQEYRYLVAQRSARMDSGTSRA